jgi:threonine dehydrogenase-like Zn-dependent dehydrogenase
MSNIKDTMLAVVAYGPKDYRLETKKTPKAGKEEVIIKIKACGVCGSDVHAYHGAPAYWGNETTKAWMIAPVTPGHEFFGEVVELGEGAAEKYKINVGDWIIAEQIIPCNKCRYCFHGDYHLCSVHNMYGFQKDIAEGGMAEYMKLGSASLIHKIPKSISLEQAAVIEPLSCSIHAVQRGNIDFQDVVVIAGAGPIGLFMIQLAHLKTPKCLVVIDLNDSRLELSKKLGADITINPLKQDPVSIVNGLTDGYGCDVYIEATGNPKGVIQGLSMIRKKGRFVEFSVFGSDTTVDWSVVGEKKELDILGAHISPYTYPIAINLLERKLITAEGIVTQTFPLKDFQAAFKQAEKLDESIKVLITP